MSQAGLLRICRNLFAAELTADEGAPRKFKSFSCV